MEKEYKVGDKVWYVIDTARLAILCSIVEVIDTFRKRSPSAFLFYDLDEPIGYEVPSYKLFDGTKEELQALLAEETWNEYAPETLEKFREDSKRFISSTWDDDHPDFPDYPDKEKGVDWFNF